MSEWNPALGRRRRRPIGGGGGLSLRSAPTSISGAPGATTQLQIFLMPANTDITSRIVPSTSNAAIGTVDAPTLTSISPATITQGTNATYTFTGTDKGNETIGGLPTGVTASGLSYTSTTVTCTLTATGGATIGVANLYLACNRGNSGTQTLTVNSSAATPPLTGLKRRYIASSGTNTTTNGAAITSWTDTIASKVLTVNSGGTPGLSYVSNAINSKPGIVAANAPGWLTEAAFDSAINTAATTIVVVYAHTGTTEVNTRPVASLRPDSNHGLSFEYPSSMGITGRFGTGSAQTSIFGATDAGGVFHTVLITASTAASQMDMYIDNAEQGTITSSAYAVNTTQPFELFAATISTITVQATICEVLIYDHVFSGAERTALHSYTISAYGI